jgi:FtsZ-binding cell division protein ZapB
MLEGIPSHGRLPSGKDIACVDALRSRFGEAGVELSIHAFEHLEAQIQSLSDDYSGDEYAAREALARYSGWHVPPNHGINSYIADIEPSGSNPSINRVLLFVGQSREPLTDDVSGGEEEDDEEVTFKAGACGSGGSSEECARCGLLESEKEAISGVLAKARADLEARDDDLMMAQLERDTALGTVRSLSAVIEELKEQRVAVKEELAALKEEKERALHQAASNKRLWSEMQDSASRASGQLCQSEAAESVAHSGALSRKSGRAIMTKSDAASIFPMSKSELSTIIPEGVVDVTAMETPYLVFPLLCLWQRKAVVDAAEEDGMKPDHAQDTCAKCQSVWSKFTARGSKELWLKHRPLYCPLNGGEAALMFKDQVDLGMLKQRMLNSLSDTKREFMQLRDDALKWFKK